MHRYIHAELDNKHRLPYHALHSELLLFLTLSVKKLLYTVANPSRGLLNKEKITKEEVWQSTPPSPPTLLVRRKIKNKNHATHLQALRRSRSVSRTYKDIFGSSTRH